MEDQKFDDEIRVLWLRPAGLDSVSVRRERIIEKLEPKNVSVDLVGATVGNFLRYEWKAARGRYDIIIGNVRLGLYGGYLIARTTGTPFVGDVSDTMQDVDHLPGPIFDLLARYERFVLRRSDGNVFLPETIKGMEEYGIDGVIAGNAVDFAQFAEPDSDAVTEAKDILQTSGVDLTEPIVLYVGALIERRHSADLVDAARIATDWQFVLVGEGPEEDEVAEGARELDNLFYPGAFEYELMPGFMYHADAAFCLVNVERPLKISEYGAAGLPTIGSHGKLETEFDEGEIYFVDPTPKQIAETLERISDNPEEAADRAERLKNHASRFSWDEVARVYENLITELAAEDC